MRAADKAIVAADDEFDDAMIDPARDHVLLQTRLEQDTLRDRALAALQVNALTSDDRALIARMQGDAAESARRFGDAATAFRSAPAIDPQNTQALSGLEYALSQASDRGAVVAIASKLATLSPSYTTEISLALAQAAIGDRDATVAAIDAAISLAEKISPAALAWTHLYAGRAAVTLEDPARAHREFLAAQAAAERIPRAKPASRMVPRTVAGSLRRPRTRRLAASDDGDDGATDRPGLTRFHRKYVQVSRRPEWPAGQGGKLHATRLPKH